MCSRTAHLDVYDMCKKLAPCMATGDDCTKLLGHNLTEDQQLALRCELGPVRWRVCVGSLGGHYCFDLGSVVDRVAFEQLYTKSVHEQFQCKLHKQADVSQRGGWGGLFRNVRLHRKPYARTLDRRWEVMLK